MGDILGHRFPTGGIKGKLVALALVSIPAAAAVGLVLGGRAVLKRVRRPETDEEKLRRLERAAYRNDIE